MKRILLSVLAAVLTSSMARAQSTERIPLDILYIGNVDTTRGKAFEGFLRERFASVRVADRRTFDAANTIGGANVVLLDWSQQDVSAEKADIADLESPLGSREAWTKPTVLLDSAGLLIATPWQTNGAYG